MLDHLVLATPDLPASVEWFVRLTGADPVPGGHHPDWGTANVIVGLGDRCYLEIIGPYAGEPPPPGGRPFGIDGLGGPRLVTWAVHPDDVDATIEHARRRGYDPGPASPMTRRTLGGEVLAWRLTPPTLGAGGGLVPFLIDWGATVHPSVRDPHPLSLRSLTVAHPDPPSIQWMLDAIDVPLQVEAGESGLTVMLDTPNGAVPL